MAEVVVQNMREGYKTLIDTVLDQGDKVSPRGQDTREVLGFILRVQDPTNNVLTGVRKGFSRGIAAAEAAQLVGGVSDPALMVRVSKNFASFLDSGSFHGAYGPRIKTQLPEVVRRLTDDPSSRQAIVQIWRPQDDLWGTTRDLPCTLGFQFFIRNEKLVMIGRMRSNDVMWGVPYDIFQFTQLQLTVANALSIGVGEYVHQVGSMHIYERDIDKLLDVESHSDEAESPFGFGEDVESSDPQERLAQAMKDARDIVDGSLDYTRNADLSWYNTSLLSYRA